MNGLLECMFELIECLDNRRGQGLAYHELRNLAEALADFNQAAKLRPNDSDVFFARGDVHFDMGEYALAVEDYSKGLDLNPQAPWALWSRALSYAQLNRVDLARADFDEAIGLSDGFDREELTAAICAHLYAENHIALSLHYCRRGNSD